MGCGSTGRPGVKARTSKGMDWIKETACEIGKYYNCPLDHPTAEPTKLPTETPGCLDSPFKIKRKSGKKVDCSWIVKKGRCGRSKYGFHCRNSCAICNMCGNSKVSFRFKPDPSVDKSIRKNCNYVKRNRNLCSLPGIAETCPKICNAC